MDGSLYDKAGHRKYLTEAERQAFVRAGRKFDASVHTFCLVLKETGCRISEALEMTADHVDIGAGCLIFRSLKKRRGDVHRAVPVSPALLKELTITHGLERRGASLTTQGERLWPWHRATAHRHVTAVMKAAGVSGPHATAKGLRHGFGVAALSRGVPINILQKWLGHADLSTTAIYGNAVGSEERKMARKMWRE